MMRIKWDREWIEEHFDKCSSVKELRREYNKAHGTNYGYKTVYGYCNRNGYMMCNLTEEQDQYIRDTYPKVGGKKLTELFNKRYGTNKTYAQMRRLVCNRKLSIENESLYRRLRQKKPRYEIGEMTQGWAEEYVKVSPTKWMRASTYIYMQNNELRPGDRVIHLDGDVKNNAIENLQAVSPYVGAHLARNKLYSKEPMITKGAILLFELQERI